MAQIKKMKSEKVSSKHIITQSYTPEYYGTKKDVSIFLEVDYHNKSLTITPRSVKQDFTFKYGKEPRKWIAMAEAIKAAAELGQELLAEDLIGNKL